MAQSWRARARMPAQTAPQGRSTARPQAARAKPSATLRARLAGRLDLADDEKPPQKVDLFPARPRGKRPAQILRDFILRAQSDEPFRPAPPHQATKPPWSTRSAIWSTIWSTRSALGRQLARRPSTPSAADADGCISRSTLIEKAAGSSNARLGSSEELLVIRFDMPN